MPDSNNSIVTNYQIPEIAIKMQTICSKNAARRALSAVRFEHGLIQATDGHRLIIHTNRATAETPDNTSWKFTGNKPKKHTSPYYNFETTGKGQASDITGKGGGNAEILQDVTYPKTSQVLPVNLDKRTYITFNAKYLYEMAKVMSKDSTVTLAIGGQGDRIIVINANDDSTLGLLMPKWTGKANELEKAENSTTQTLENIKLQFKTSEAMEAK